MLRPRDVLICGLLVSCTPCLGASSAPDLLGAGTIGHPRARRLQGRFLHITDFHPDPHYKTYSSTEEDAACHRKRGPAGYYGAETSACDSPKSLVNATMEWIKDNLADQIDFVIWTGDSARHDNDEKLPRTQKEIIQLNEFMVRSLTNVFGTGDDGDGDPTNDYAIPIVPTFGNNDIMPHNILLAGPNKWTLRYLDIWRGFIPEAQRHQFQQGGWFYVEVIPKKLAVISLNTMYFFTSNSGVDGCANKHEPGYEQFEWLRIQLQLLRDRGMHAMLVGHVPPARVDSKESWDETCWQKYALWERQYRDVIVGSFFGHMNIDHFMLQDFKQIKKSTKKGAMTSAKDVKNKEGEISLLEEGEVTVASASDYLLDLRQAWAKLPSPPSKSQKKSLPIADYFDADEEDAMSTWERFLSIFSKSEKGRKDKKPKSDKEKYLNKIGGKYAERYSVNLVSPSVVPNFFPTLRVFEYNITGLENIVLEPVHNSPKSHDSLLPQQPISDNQLLDDEAYMREVESAIKRKHKKEEKDAHKKKKYKFKVPKRPSKSSLPGPAYSPQPLTLISYTQYFANLTHINNDFVASSKSDLPEGNATHTVFGLDVSEDGDVDASKWKEGKHHGHQGKKPRPKPHPKTFKFEVEYDTRSDKRYKLKDLTVRSFVDLARRIGRDALGKKGVEESVYEDGDDDLSDDEEYDDDDVEDVEEDDDDLECETKVETSKKSKKGKKGKKHKKKPSKNGAWFAFVQRAFVGTMDPHDIEDMFGVRAEEAGDTPLEEVMEL
ncbi:Endopolyphosphatase [Lentithecium fluviatile CBS 122367]|uniref:Endopolyphosphatase n=1 Tax=Lentithecium fluviatile CBS 122367 TaxID=1168545 RepID=A0A6G1JL06_9PLEO|nr:Endopolyphosphatase [Lentithecium fluviatile CBS 122367]